MNNQLYQSCIEACIECAQECDNCATACLEESDVAMMLRCIELNRLCAEACYAAARMMTIGGKQATAFCQACAELCDACASECKKHAGHGVEHCRKCYEACSRCAIECRAMSAQSKAI